MLQQCSQVSMCGPFCVHFVERIRQHSFSINKLMVPNELQSFHCCKSAFWPLLTWPRSLAAMQSGEITACLCKEGEKRKRNTTVEK